MEELYERCNRLDVDAGAAVQDRRDRIDLRPVMMSIDVTSAIRLGDGAAMGRAIGTWQERHIFQERQGLGRMVLARLRRTLDLRDRRLNVAWAGP